MRIVYLGTPEFAVFPLQHLAESSSHEVVAVVTQSPKEKGRGRKIAESPVALYAHEAGLKVLTPEKASRPDFLEELKALKPDLCVTCAYGKILTQKFLDIPSRGTINIHPSLLPAYRGAVPVQAALLDGLEKTGVTILFTVKALDAGNLITQKEFSIEPSEKAGELMPRLFRESCSLLDEAFLKLEDENFEGTPQKEDLVTHCEKILKEDGLILWGKAGKEVFNAYRAYSPWPGSYSFYQGKRVLIEEMGLSESELPEDELLDKPGRFVFSKKRGSLRVRTASSVLEIFELKPEGKKKLRAQDFWNQISKADRQTCLFEQK